MDRKQIDKMKDEELKRSYNDRLKKLVEKKFNTTMIFPLSEFESAFGFIWGHGKSRDKLNDSELQNLQYWEECRTKILNNGNKQKRNALNEIDEHEVVWKRHTAVFLPVTKYNEVGVKE